ncbi:MAG: DUF1127 domain-containing protein [Rhodospirillales bacterium]|nr:DUF1127 domain-containing protein [Rhodospirillales bacterium]
MNTQCNQLQPLPRQFSSSSRNIAAFEIQNLTTWVDRVTCRFMTTFRTWRQRSKERNELAAMSPAQAKDIGLTMTDLRQEANKEFWQN